MVTEVMRLLTGLSVKMKFDPIILSHIPYRQKLADRLEDLFNYERYGAPFQEGDYTYYFHNDGLQNHSVLYREDKKMANEPYFLIPIPLVKMAPHHFQALNFHQTAVWQRT